MTQDKTIEEILVKCINTLNRGNDTYSAIMELLAVIGDFYSADRAYIFEFEEEMVYMNNTYEWSVEENVAMIERFGRLPISTVSRWFRLFREKGEVVILNRDEEVASTSKEYKLLVDQSVTGLFVVPMYKEKKLIGFIGVDNPKDNKDVRILLHSAGALISSHIEKRVTKEQMALMALAKAYVSLHVINLKDDEVIDFNSTVDIKHFEAQGVTCVEKMRIVMENVTAASSREMMLSFADLSTINDRMRQETHSSMEFLNKDDKWHRCHFIVIDRASNGDINNLICAVELIDAEKRKQLAYQDSIQQDFDDQNAIYAEILRMQSEGVIASDSKTQKILVVNAAALQMFGFARKEDIGADFAKMKDKILMVNGRIYDETTSKEHEQNENYALLNGNSFACEYAIDAGNSIVHVQCKTKQITLPGGQKITVRSLSDISKQKNTEQQLLSSTRIDALTNLYNREYGEKCVEEMLTGGEGGMLCVIDIDRFRNINDTYGRAVGDLTLIALSEELQVVMRDEDIGFRRGSDEFAVFVAGVDNQEEGTDIINRFFMTVSKMKITEMGDRSVSISLGAVICKPGDRRRLDDIYKLADEVVRNCKNNRGNQFGFAKQ